MREFFSNLGRRIRTGLIGRYGIDEFSRFLMILGIVFLFLGIIRPLQFLAIPAWMLVIYAYYRCFSKNIVKRSNERDRYLRITGKFKGKFSVYGRMWKERKTHKYYRCSVCRTMVRVPRGKGKIAITCPKCRNEFIKTT
ncbi:MAG: hypothetical protein K6E32_06710 [Lachnospiraceae bacterium]|nr:hypothetical protein [Lachnospiraceae bacterium]